MGILKSIAEDVAKDIAEEVIENAAISVTCKSVQLLGRKRAGTKGKSKAKNNNPDNEVESSNQPNKQTGRKLKATTIFLLIVLAFLAALLIYILLSHDAKAFYIFTILVSVIAAVIILIRCRGKRVFITALIVGMAVFLILNGIWISLNKGENPLCEYDCIGESSTELKNENREENSLEENGWTRIDAPSEPWIE
ncbi:MAG: hypothetical protein K6F68_08620 [Clostridiales bacterium]|nr:hypothetical protein [Clostridiales bacterium]